MATSFSLLATLVSSVFAVALLRRWLTAGRSSRALLWWGASVSMFAVASLMLAVGALAAWAGASFRTFYLFGAVLNVPWLALGSVEINRRAPVVERVTGAAMLVVGALFLPAALGDSTELALPGAVLGLSWGALLGFGRVAWLGRASFGLILAFSLVAAVAVTAADLTGPVPASGMPEGRELFSDVVRGLAVGGNAVGAVAVIVSALAASANLVWARPARGSLRAARTEAERGLTDLVARWLFRGRRGVGTWARGLVRGNLLIAAGVTVAGAGGAIGGIEGHAVGLGAGVTLMYAGFVLTLRRPV